MSICHVPFAVIVSSNPDLWHPCLYWSHFLHDSLFLLDASCLGKGSIVYPTRQTQLKDVIRSHSVSVAGCWPFCRICIFLYLLSAQLRENYGNVRRLGFKMNGQSSEMKDKKEVEIYFKVRDQNLKPRECTCSCYSECDPWTGGPGTTGWLMTNAKPQAPLRTY